MAFDLSTARPVQRFDPSTARPVGGEEELTPVMPQRTEWYKKKKEKEFKDEYYRKLNESLGGVEAATVGFQRGMRTVGRGLGMLPPENAHDKASLDRLSDQRGEAFAGEIIGETLPFLPAGGLAALPAKLAARLGLTAAVGAAEGGILTRGRGGSDAQTAIGAGIGATIATVMELAAPHLGRVFGAVFRKLGRKPKGRLVTAAGEPTQEMLDALNDAGMTWDEVTDTAVEYIVKHQDELTDPAAVARASRFEKHGVPYTKGDVTQDFAQQSQEQRLLQIVSDQQAEPVRQLKLQQSQAYVTKVNEFIDSLGLPNEAGVAIKAGLNRTKKLLRAQKNRLYRKAGEVNKNILDTPIFGDTIIEALPDQRTLTRLSRLEGGQVKALQSLLVEFGIDQSDKAVEAFTKSGGEVVPLTVGNLEDFRSALNQIVRADKTGAASVAAGPIIGALDNEADEVIKSLKAAGIDDQNILGILSGARSTVRELRQGFSPQSISGRLVDAKADGVTPVVEASQVVRELTNKPVEQLQRVLSQLGKSGRTGRKAIGDLRASVVMSALEDALKAETRKIDGIPVVSGNMFYKNLKKFGDEKLDLLFRGDEAGRALLDDLAKIGRDMTPSGGAVPKGSAAVNIDLMSGLLGRLTHLPMLGEIVALYKKGVEAKGDQEVIMRAINAKPELARTVRALEKQYPSVLSALGIAVTTGETEQ